MKLHMKKIALISLIFSSSAFSFHSQSYICRSASGGILFGGNAPIAEIPYVNNLCTSIGGNLTLGPRNNGPIN